MIHRGQVYEFVPVDGAMARSMASIRGFRRA